MKLSTDIEEILVELLKWFFVIMVGAFLTFFIASVAKEMWKELIK